MSDRNEEARAFDEQIVERIAHGHIPDLRLTQPCDYFYNNPWRRPGYVKLDFGQIFARIDSALRTHGPRDRRIKLLEIGCGPGFMSLELARAGHAVVGLDLSPKAIEIATQFANSDPWKASRGPLEYRTADFLSDDKLANNSFDAIVMVGALHHFADQAGVARRIHRLLHRSGLVIAHEPTRDRCTMGLAAFVYFTKFLLSVTDGFFEACPVPRSESDLASVIKTEFNRLRYEGSDGDKKQSPHDNDAGYAEMHAMLTTNFCTLILEDTFAFFHELIGGLRFNEEKNAVIAHHLRDLDALLVKNGVLPPTEFFFVGQMRDI